MAETYYEEGKLWGEDRDPTLKWEGLRGLDDERLGKLLRALGKTASVYREAERSGHCPPFEFGAEQDYSEEAEEARRKAYDRFVRHINVVDGHIGKVITGVIDYSNLDPNRMAMYKKSAIFKEGEPVLYWEHWGTDDLDDPGRDPVEFQMFVGLNGHLQTEAGRKLAHNILDTVLDGSMISPQGVPSGMSTFGTVPKEVFAPFVRPTGLPPTQ